MGEDVKVKVKVNVKIMYMRKLLKLVSALPGKSLYMGGLFFFPRAKLKVH